MIVKFKEVFLWFVFVLCTNYSLADSSLFKAEILPSNELKTLVGVPAQVTVRINNISGSDQIPIYEGVWHMYGKPCGTQVIACGMGVTTPEAAAELGIINTPPAKVSKDWSTQYQYDLATLCELKTAGQYELEYRVLGGYYDTPPIEPAVVKITIAEPDEKERQVYDWLQECYSNLKSVSLSSCYKDLLTNYPHSIYSAWIILPALAEPENYKPEIAKQVVETSYYPSGNSVPDEEFGFRDIAEGGSMAKWQINWAEKILIDHPDFPYRERLQLVIALNKLTLNDEKAGMNLLASMSHNDTEIGQWCKKFLSLK